ncbi:uncharacterized protein LOC124168009 isoform X2 [Ischnura elegans]|uniref:uncharacterized protein LOC124168009 isoform X2 n=1 Tax=Ischnura elegans TaxID=197161 RepID=UPI001ED8AEF6|nr:uncharacterized protein LOC124168009 isoform X2 [Ischnura elegans]
MEMTTLLPMALLMCLPLGGTGENFFHEDDRVLAYETTVPMSGEEPFDGTFPEKSPVQPAKRSTPPILRENKLRAKAGDVPYLTKSRGLPVPSTPSGWKETRRPLKTNQFGVFPTDVKVCVGEDIVFRAWGAIGKLKNCTVLTPKKDFVQLQPPPPNPSKNSRITYYDFGEDGERCGFRVRGVTKEEDWGTWNLTVTTDKVTLTLDPGMSVVDCPNGTEEHNMLLPGEKTNVHCGPPDVTACYLEAPGGSKNTPAELQAGRCQTPNVPFSNLMAGEWTCNWVPKGSMLQRTSKADIEYAELPSDMDIGLEWRNETSSSPMGHKATLDLRCNYRGQSTLIKMCKIAQPGGKVFYPSDGLAHGRYSYLGRGLANGDCGLSIELPLQPEDIGVWRCEVFLFGTGADERGGFIEVGIANRTREEKLRSLKPWGPLGGAKGRVSSEGNLGTLEVMTGDSLVIGCSADAPLTLCLIRRPDGNASAPSQLSSGDDLYEAYGRGEGLGDCGIRVKATQGANHTGRWECVVSIDFGDAQVIPIDVVVHEKPLTVEIDGGAAWHGYPANFSCRSVLGVSLDHCRFERPDRTIVTVMDSRHPNAHQASWSHGLHAVSDLGVGLCSVHIPQMREEDFGEWTCIARAQDSKKDFQLRFHVAAGGISAASAGAITGIVLVVAVCGAIAGAVIYRRRLRQRRDGDSATIQGAGTDDSVISFRPDDDEEDASSAG